MEPEEKLLQMTGAGASYVAELPECWGTRHARDIPRLGIQTLRITNGPVGVGQNDCVLESDPQPQTSANSAKATALPSAIAMAASFDRDMARLYGEVIATEMNNLGLHVFEAPGVNMARIPLLGRNFEYFGEDPYLSGTMAVEESKAIQAAGLIAMPKHFVANEQETHRRMTRSTVDDQVLREIYLIPFEMAVKDAKVGSIMCAYNYINGVAACENETTLTRILRDEWGWTGYVQTDFGASRSVEATLVAGLDHEMDVPVQWIPETLQTALDDPDNGVTWERIDRALERRFTQMFKHGILDRPLKDTPIAIKGKEGAVDFVVGGEKAREIGVKASVLLKNRNGFLPLDPEALVDNSNPNDTSYVTIIGKATQVYAQQAVAGGAVVGKVDVSGGSSDVIPYYSVKPVEGIADALGVSVGSNKIRLILVDDSNYLVSVNGVPMSFADAMNNHINQTNNKAIIIMAGTIAEEGGDRGTVYYTTSLDGGPMANLANYCGMAQMETMGIRCSITGLGFDHNPDFHPSNGMTLDWYTDRLTQATKASGTKNSHTQDMIDTILNTGELKHRTVLVLKDNASFSVPDRLLGNNGPSSILEVWFPGQEDGNIVADLLFGKANPSGKLPVTFPKEGKGFMDHIDVTQFPGTVVGGLPVVEYSEGLNMGYRWYDANFVSAAGCTVDAYGENACVAFPFGYGLSYTTFSFANHSVTPNGGKYDVKVRVKNEGGVKGAEVVQVYLQLPDSANSGNRLQQPPKRLVGFAKVELEPGASQDVIITIDPDASNHPLSVWDKATNRWVTPTGSYNVLVGNSSSLKDLASVGTFSR
jgi:beta-glucosidase